MDLNLLSEEEQIKVVKKDLDAFYKINEPTEAVCLVAVSKRSGILKEIKNPTDAVVKAALKKSGLAIASVSNPTEEQMIIAIRKNPKAFFRLSKTTEKVELEALQYLSPTEVLRYVRTPSYAVWLKVVELQGKLLRRVPASLKTEELCLKAVQSEGMALRYVPAALKTEEMIEIALKEDGCVINLLKQPTEKQIRLAVQSDVSAMLYLENIPQTLYEELADYVVTHSDGGLRYLREPGKDLIDKALKHSLVNAKYIPSSFWTKELLWRVVRAGIYFDLSKVDSTLYDERIKLELLKITRSAVGYFEELTPEMIQTVLMEHPLYAQSEFDIPDDLKLMLVQCQAQTATSNFFKTLTHMEWKLWKEIEALPMRDFSLSLEQEVQEKPVILFDCDVDKRSYRLSRLAIRLDPTLAKFSPYFVSCLDELERHKKTTY